MKPLTHGLKLKSVLYELEVTYEKAAEAAGTSRASLINVINKNSWPRTIAAETLQENVERFLKEKGATAEQLDKLWDWHEDLAVEKREEIHNGNGKAKKKSMGVRMIDQECMAHFGLKKNPFPRNIQSKAEMLWTPAFRRAHKRIIEAIETRQFSGVVGESGSGKTTLRLMIESEMKKNPHIRFIAPLDIERERMRPHTYAEAIIRDLDPGRTSMPNRKELKWRLARKLLTDATNRGENPVMFIEEAHALTNESLKAIKRIIEMGGGLDSIITVVLFAQPEILSEKFAVENPALREVALRCMLIPLEGIHRDIEKYLAHKIEMAGGKLDTVFSADGVRALKKRLKPDKNGRAIITPLHVHEAASNAMMLAIETSEPKVTADVIKVLDRYYFQS